MAGRRGVGRPPTKKAVTDAGKNAAKRSSANTDSLSSLTRQEQRRGRHSNGAERAREEDGEEEVTLVYRKPSAHSARSQSGAAGAAATTLPPDAAGTSSVSVAPHSTAASSSSPEKSVLSFVQRATGLVNLSRYLSHCAVRDARLCSADGQGVYEVTQEQIFHCSTDRLETAIQALLNMESLVFTPVDTSSVSGTPWVGHACWVRPAQLQAMVALARVCEAAVPLQLPSLVDPTVAAVMDGKERSSMTWVLPLEMAGALKRSGPPANIAKAHESRDGNAADKSGTAGATAPSFAAASTQSTSTITTANVELVPSPVRLSDVHLRLCCLRRLRQLRIAYGTLLPRLHSAGSITDLCRSLFSHETDACQTLGRLHQIWMTGGPPVSLPALNNSFPPSTAHALNGTDGSPARAKALRDLLSSFLGNPLLLDSLLPLAGISARHPQEEALLQHLVALLKQTTAVDASTWGPMAAMASWRCTDGLYVGQHAARVRALRRVLAEAQFYGLPRFLRSIRVASATAAGEVGTTPYAFSGSGDNCWMKPTALLRAQSRDLDRFFLTPDLLDPTSFMQPDSMQVQLVQEELITLQRSHCGFCLVVGEADEVVTLLHDHLAFMGRIWQHLAKKEEESSAVKAEPSTGDSEEGSECCDARASVPSPASCFAHKKQQHSRPIDPLHLYALRTVDAARRYEREKKKTQQQQQPDSASSSSAPSVPLPFSHVQWVECGSTNKWSPNTHYYGLVYMVVLETDEWETDEVSLMTEGLLPGTAISIAEGEGAETLRPPQTPTYCVNSLLELWRS
ncbi:hypothetical protein ABL78_0131 [Leptomonas seymouri]|uniref:Uncharacterized protein n=1 Tax=Leptomonas seymouri TaxID=5684 RepID=A0A0N1IMM3_LEPSE|nr:hypothetical protein ABL78_0131 [Leptomonas seymouri]|eukprot:KPI90695.1 hypothetical protein ABL78_0131 [Leptomonas seymouri]